MFVDVVKALPLATGIISELAPDTPFCNNELKIFIDVVVFSKIVINSTSSHWLISTRNISFINAMIFVGCY